MKKQIISWCIILFCSVAHSDTKFESKESQFPGSVVAREQGKINAKRLSLPLKKTRVQMTLIGNVLRTELVQEFKNETAVALEAAYVFPLPSNSAVYDMVMEFDERIIRSVVKEKQEAKRVYEKAKKAGKKTALLDQSRPNIFKTSVANFMPGETMKVKLVYVESLDYKKGEYVVNFPMVVGPRYIPISMKKRKRGAQNTEDINPPIIHPRIKVDHHLELDLEISGLPVESVKSTTHIIDSREEGGIYKISLREAIPNADFNLKIKLDTQQEATVTLVEDGGEEDKYSMISILPPTIAQKNTVAVPRDVIFLIDTSGSMDGASISQARLGLKKCLQLLGSKDKFSIVRFSSDYSSLSPNLMELTESNRELAETYIDELQADGGTEMQPALDYCLSIKGRAQAARLLIFLTDGDVGNEDDLMRLVNTKLGKTRLFTFGIGSAPNEYLMKKIAELGRGQSRFIRSHEDVGVVMSDFLKTLSVPVMTDVVVNLYDDSGAEINDISFYPQSLPDLFHERPLRGFFRSDKSVSRVELRGLVNGEVQSRSYELGSNKEDDRPLVRRLYGREVINDLMLQYLLAKDQQSSDEIKKRIVAIGLQYQLVSQFTSRVAVEEKISRTEDLVKVNIPNHLPRGSNPAQFTSTGTNDTFYMLLGLVLVLLALGFKKCSGARVA